MIDHKHKFVFIHIPKTGGISIHQVLRSKPCDRNHAELHTHEFDENYFKFMFVRNPWDRIVSCYNYFLNGGRGFPGDIEAGKMIQKYETFTEFCIAFPSIRDTLKSICPHFKPQATWFDKNIDHVGKFENLQLDFDTICDSIGIPRKKLPHKNKSNHKYYTEYYNSQTHEIVAEQYARDIELFGYGGRE
jgi:chondroitin 4-sulfotransferase 11